MNKHPFFHCADKNKFSIVVSKITAYNYDYEKQILRIFTSGDEEPFICSYFTKEELIVATERLQQIIAIRDLHD